ncbi:MAG TPA: hypothetical protein VGI93_13105 [Steroidobacteraceae bacterium]|jgi:hypothetical protein
MTSTKFALLGVVCCTAAIAYAQDPPATPPKDSAQAEAGEPRADTSARPSPQAEAGEPRANTSSAAPAQAKPTPPPPKAAAKPGQKPSNAADHVELSTATVTGDREQPKVMYIVPWKRSDIGDLEGKPMNSLVDEVLSPVDRDVFKREVRYYDAVKSDAPSPSGAVPPKQGEK